MLTRGIDLYRSQKYIEALECFNQIISQDPNSYQAYHYRGLIRRKQRDDQGAITDLQMANTLIADGEYTNIFQKMQDSIGKDYPHHSNNESNDNADFIYIEYMDFLNPLDIQKQHQQFLL